MTLSEIRARTLEQAGELEPLPGALNEVLLHYINEGINALCPDGALHSMQLSASGGAATLPEGVLAICSVSDALGRDVPFRASGSAIYLSPDGAYTARLMIAPTPLLDLSDAPALPEAYHGALADYAAWRLLSTGGRAQQARAEHYHQAFLLQKSQYQRHTDAARGPRSRVNKYAQGG